MAFFPPKDGSLPEMGLSIEEKVGRGTTEYIRNRFGYSASQAHEIGEVCRLGMSNCSDSAPISSHQDPLLRYQGARRSTSNTASFRLPSAGCAAKCPASYAYIHGYTLMFHGYVIDMCVFNAHDFIHFSSDPSVINRSTFCWSKAPVAPSSGQAGFTGQPVSHCG